MGTEGWAVVVSGGMGCTEQSSASNGDGAAASLQTDCLRGSNSSHWDVHNWLSFGTRFVC